MRHSPRGYPIDAFSPGGAVPLFLISARNRDELVRAAERAGWSTATARDGEHVDRAFLASGAAVTMVDARDGFADALATVRALAVPVQSAGAALLVLVGRRDATFAAAAFEAGATHYLASPFTAAELAQALRYAARHAERMTGGRPAGGGGGARDDAEPLRWRWSSARPHRVTINAALARAAGLPASSHEIGRAEAARLLGRDGWRALARGVGRFDADAPPIAHAAADGSRLTHHLTLDAEGRITARIEVGVADGAIEAPASGRPRDPLTGLDDGHGARAWIDARLVAERPTLLVLGLGRFDMVNAAFGRATGDAIIRAVARRIERAAGHGAAGHGAGGRRLLSRLAGAEFAIGLPAIERSADAERIAADLVAAIARPFVAGDHVVTLAARVGIATAAADVADAGELIRRASLALADARDGEAARVRIYEAGEDSRRAEDSRLELDLRRALDEERIEIVWQPQVSVATGKVCGAEALTRWRHPELGEIGAEALFAAAERSDYTVELSAHVQERALAAAAGWEGTLAGLPVSINVTATDIADTGFADAMLARIDAAGVARDRVTVEVTEGGLIAELGDAAALLARLRAAGLRVAIDDFGTGYSSLAYLKALPLDTIKIDRALAQDIAGSPRDRIVVRSVIEMARSLGLTVVAEGVETEEQLALLAREGCTLYQGFLFSAPVDAAALAALA